MTLPAFASLEDFEIRIGQTFQGADAARAQAVLDDASALVRAAANKTWVINDALDPTMPDAIRAITLTVAVRALLNPSGMDSQTIGNSAFVYGEKGVFLTTEEQALVRDTSGLSSIGSLPMVTPWSMIGTDYIEVVGSDKPIPYVEP